MPHRPEEPDERPRSKKPQVAPRAADDRDDPDDRPRPKKKKKKKPKPSNTPLIVGGVVGGVVLLALVVAGVFLLRPRPAPKPTAPQSYAAYDSPDEVFHVSMPGGWKVKSSGLKGTGAIGAENGPANIKLHESLTGSLVGDIAGAASDPNAPDEYQPVSKVHEHKKPEVAEEYNGYTEKPATSVATGFGKARRSEFAGKAGLSGQVRGYRVTALGALTQITVVCVCPAGDWDTWEPVFAKVIASIGPGPAPDNK